MDIKKGYVINDCGYCGNKTKLDIEASNKVETRGEFDSDTYWLILECSVCKNISFAKNYTGEDMMRYYNDRDGIIYDDNFNILFPINTYQGFNVPEQVHKAFEVALKASYLDDAICLISLRRTLEIICKQQGEAKGDLVKKIHNLAEKGILLPV